MFQLVLFNLALGVPTFEAAQPDLKTPSTKWHYSFDAAGSDDFDGDLSKWNNQLGEWKGKNFLPVCMFRALLRTPRDPRDAFAFIHRC